MLRKCLLTSMIQDASDSCGGKIGITYHRINGHDVIICWNYNQFYGDLLKQWSIDGNNISERNHKYPECGPLIFDCSHGLLADPPYPEGKACLADFCELLDIDPTPFRNKHNVILITYHDFCKLYPAIQDQDAIEAMKEGLVFTE